MIRILFWMPLMKRIEAPGYQDVRSILERLEPGEAATFAPREGENLAKVARRVQNEIEKIMREDREVYPIALKTRLIVPPLRQFSTRRDRSHNLVRVTRCH